MSVGQAGCARARTVGGGWAALASPASQPICCSLCHPLTPTTHPAPLNPPARSFTGLLEAAGYASLIYLIKESGKVDIYGAYVVFQVFTVMSPNLLQATDYWTVSG